MTISLLRQIWQRIVDKQAPAKQRLTGFEPLEPRMVLSGFSAMLPPDYFSPPAGDFSHVEQSGAEYAKLAGNEFSREYGRLSDYMAPAAGVSQMVEPQFVGFVSFGPIMSAGGMHDLMVKPLEGVTRFDGAATDSVLSNGFAQGAFNSFSGNDLALTANLSSALSVRVEFAPVQRSIIEHVMGDGESNWVAGSLGRFDSFLSISSSSLSVGLGSPLNSVVVSGLVPSSLNAALEGRMEVRAASVEGAGAPRSAALDASLAHAVSSEGTTRSSSSATTIAMLATPADGLRGSNSTGIADNSSNGGQEQGPANPAAAHDQGELDEAYAVGRRGLKRKLPGDITALDETDGEDAALVQETADGDIVLLIESGRQFDPAGNRGTQIPELAMANLPADGLIDVLAADVDSRTGEHKLLETGRLALVEPAMMAYQAFEMVIDRNSQAEGRVADAADVASVAMTEHPVVQVQ